MISVCKCKRITEFVDEGKVQIEWSPRFRKFSIPLKNSSASQTIYYCPWCGDKLPEPLGDRWFEELEKLGFDEPFEQSRSDPSFPKEFLTDEWWRNNPELNSSE